MTEPVVSTRTKLEISIKISWASNHIWCLMGIV